MGWERSRRSILTEIFALKKFYVQDRVSKSQLKIDYFCRTMVLKKCIEFSLSYTLFVSFYSLSFQYTSFQHPNICHYASTKAMFFLLSIWKLLPLDKYIFPYCNHWFIINEFFFLQNNWCIIFTLFRFCRLGVSQNLKIFKVTIDKTLNLKIDLQLFLSILGNTKIKIGQISLQHISNLFLDLLN